MRGLTGFEPRVRFDDGVRELFEYLRDSPVPVEQMLARIEDRNWVVRSDVHV
jgi:hypothetical protein